MHPCEVCGKTDDKKPMCFRGMKWCSDNHRKILLGELPAEIVKESDDEGPKE